MAQMDARIILAGQPVNALGALNAGTTAAANANQVGRDNAMSDLFRTQGAGILSGDAGALNALAGLDPMAALDVRSTQQQMSERQERLAMARTAAARQAQQAAAQMSQQEREAEAAQIRQGLLYLSPLYSRGDRAAFDAAVAQLDPEGQMGITFDSFESQAARADGVLEVLESFDARNAGPAPEYRTVGGQIVNMNAEGGPQVVFEGEVAPETVVNVGGSTPAANADYVEARQEQFAARMQTFEEAEASARSALQSLQVMSNAMENPDFYSGAGGETAMMLRRAAVALGLADPESVADMETFHARAQAAALDAMGGSLGAGFSNADRDFVVNQVPNIGNTPEGNRRLIEIQRAIQMRNIEVARMARQYEAQNGQIDTQFLTELDQWAQDNPLFEQAAPAAAASSGPIQRPESIPQELWDVMTDDERELFR